MNGPRHLAGGRSLRDLRRCDLGLKCPVMTALSIPSAAPERAAGSGGGLPVTLTQQTRLSVLHLAGRFATPPLLGALRVGE